MGDALSAVVEDLATSGIKVRVADVYASGETRSAHRVVDQQERQWVLKWSPASTDSLGNLERMVSLVDRLRDLGYPAPRHLAVGQTDEWAYWVQELLPGEPIHSSPASMPDDARLAALAHELVELALLHADAGDLADPPWPGWLLRTLTHGGDGYCIHETMRRSAETARMLDDIHGIAATCHDAPVRRHDITHFDSSYANALTDGTRVTGVIDWNVPFPGALQGDHAFDIATLLFYAYDRSSVRRELWRVLPERADPRAIALYLAHLTLRQVEWVVRFYPGTHQHRRFLAIGRHVLDDVHQLVGLDP